ncbi:ABC transporter substrate-binding protein [Paenibacillus harenae]|uniref:ABC transporter substrate-binding protein n=1 Tax=Paenibacillus harenae TaxID=306543 RepID=UPI00041AED2A|nr:extracellular solute-binding protein [Paenibacillus harenae]
MRKAFILLFTFLYMITAAACSTGAGNGNGNAAQSPQGDQTTKPPGQGETVGAPSTTEKKTVVFSTFFPDDFFKEAKQKYEALHPNITIELQSIESDDANLEAALEKFVKTTNTALLSGKGPDLIEMDQLPSGDYVAKQLLVNMSELIENDPSFKKEQYFTNVLDGITENGGIYGMPMSFFLFGLFGNKDLLEKSGVNVDDKTWTWSQFADTARELAMHTEEANQAVLGGSMPEYTLTQFVNDQYANFVDEKNGKAKFETAAFADLLAQVKSLYDDKVVSGDIRSIIFRLAQVNSPADYIREIRQSEFMPNNRDFKSKLYVKPHSDGLKPGSFFRTYKTIGLNAKSTVKAEAWDFVKFMISEEMQSGSKSTGFPIHKASYEKSAQELLKIGKVESDQPIGPMKGQMFEITQRDIDDLDWFLNHAIYPVQFKPSKIDEILTEETKAYFSGQKSAEAVAEIIQNRVTTVLNE